MFITDLPSPCKDPAPLLFLDAFSGPRAGLAREVQHLYDVTAATHYDVQMGGSNVLSWKGFQELTALVHRVQPGGCVWLAPPCNMWLGFICFMSASVHKRTACKPQGDTEVPDVRSLATNQATLLVVGKFG